MLAICESCVYRSCVCLCCLLPPTVSGVCVAARGTGYNELVYTSAEWNAHMPKSIEAFFIVRDHFDDKARDMHRRFLDQYHLTASDVPLLSFDPSNFEAPFAEVCEDFCHSWKCDGSTWCQGGQPPEKCWGCAGEKFWSLWA